MKDQEIKNAEVIEYIPISRCITCYFEDCRCKSFLLDQPYDCGTGV